MGEFKRSNGDFNKALESAGYQIKKSNKGSLVYGLRLLNWETPKAKISEPKAKVDLDNLPDYDPDTSFE